MDNSLNNNVDGNVFGGDLASYDNWESDFESFGTDQGDFESFDNFEEDYDNSESEQGDYASFDSNQGD